MTLPTLKTALATYGNTRPLKEGTVEPSTFRFAFEEVPLIVQAFRRMVRGLEFEICEMAVTTYLCARAHGKRFTAIPVFPMRGLHHGAIVYNAKTGVRSPKDLEGRKVGVNRGYTVTTGVWARAILQHEYGVDLNSVTWVLSGDEHVAEYEPPPNVVPITPGRTLEDLLLAGELVAVVGAAKIESPDVQPLIPQAEKAGMQSLRDRGLYPINHTIVVRDDLLERMPELAGDLFQAFAAAKRLYLESLRVGALQEPTPLDGLYRRIMEETGDPLPYGVEPNRAMLEALIAHALEQGIIRDRFRPEDLFPRSTLEMRA